MNLLCMTHLFLSNISPDTIKIDIFVLFSKSNKILFVVDFVLFLKSFIGRLAHIIEQKQTI